MVEKIISGGQTGVDRAALDFALERRIAHGGWVPKGRLSEDGRVPDLYQMDEHPAPTYPPRTEANVQDADATVIFTNGPLNDERGCLLTASLCLKLKKPYTVINLIRVDEETGAVALRTLLQESRAKVLNVAGARGSRNPDVAKVRRILGQAMDHESVER